MVVVAGVVVVEGGITVVLGVETKVVRGLAVISS